MVMPLTSIPARSVISLAIIVGSHDNLSAGIIDITPTTTAIVVSVASAVHSEQAERDIPAAGGLGVAAAIVVAKARAVGVVLLRTTAPTPEFGRKIGRKENERNQTEETKRNEKKE